MRKFIVILALVCGMSTQVSANSGVTANITFSVGKIKNGNGTGNPLPKNPITPPEVVLEDHTLTFDSSCHGLTLQLVNEDGDVEYTTIISSSTMVLPSSLEGEYEIRIICDDYYFYGYIEL